MSTSFIPHADAGALNWMKVFAQGITANPATYKLTADDAAAISTAVSAFAAAYAANIDPATRTKVSVNTKNEKRVAAETLCRQYAAIIRVNATVTDSDKIAIGVRPVNRHRTRTPGPTTHPVLQVDGSFGNHTLRFATAATPDNPAKPFGVATLQLFMAVGDAHVSNPAAARLQGAYTRNGIRMEFDADQDGKVATYFARWCGVRGDFGPWSQPVFMRIAA